MKMNYEVNRESLLVYQLYFASQSRRIQRQRKLGWFVVTIPCLILVPLYISSGYYAGAFVLGIIGLIWLAGYPFYSRWRYRRHYEKHIDEALKGMMNRKVSIELAAELLLEDEFAKSQIKLEHIQSVVFIPGFVILMLQTGQGITLPRDQLGKDLDTFVDDLLSRTRLELTDHSHWKWK